MAPELTADYRENVHTSATYFQRAFRGRVDPGPIRDSDDILVVGSGSSDSMARVLRDVLCRSGRHARTCSPYELTRHEHIDDELVVGISQSGETTDVIDAIARASAAGCQTVGITAAADSSLGQRVDHRLCFEPEGEYLLSRACGVMSCLGLLLNLAQTLGIEPPETGVDRVIERVRTVTDTRLHAALECGVTAEYVFLGAASVRAIAREAALSVREASFKSASDYDIKDFAHGTAFRHADTASATIILLEAADDDTAVFDTAESMLEDLGHEPIRMTSVFEQPWATADTLAWSLAFSAQLNTALGVDLADPPAMAAVWTLLDRETTPQEPATRRQ